MKKAVGIIITVSMIMGSTMMAWADTTTSKYETDEATGGTAFSTQPGVNEGESKEVYGKYNVTDIKDVNGDGVPDTDTKDNKGTEDAADDEYGSDSNGDGKPDGDGTPDKIPDYANNGDNNNDGTVNNADIADGKNKSESSDFDDGGDAIAPEGAVFSVDVVWGNMKYDYNVSGAEWDPDTHTYTNPDSAKWEGRDDAVDANDLNSEQIKVTNNSNVAIRVRYNFESKLKDANNQDINLVGTFKTTDLQTAKPMMKLQHSVGRLPASDIAALDITGNPGTAALDNANLGTVTIKIDYTII